MTTDRDFDRISRAWLDLMPDEAPDRVTAAVLQAVETMPQAGRPLAAIRRSFRMNRFSLAAVAVVAIAVVGGGLLVSQLATPSVGGPSPSVQSPAPSSSPSAPATLPLPAGLIGTWLGGHHDVPGLGDPSGAALHVAEAGLGISPSNNQAVGLLGATGSLGADNRIHVSTPTVDRLCSPGVDGSYSFSLSPSGQTLTLTAVADACAARAKAIAGDWWLADCKRAQPCFGPLDAGDYGSEYFDPRAGTRLWEPRFGALTFAVPDGWAVSQDHPNLVRLTPQDDYAKEGDDGPAPGAIYEIDVYSAPRAQAPDSNCDPKADEHAGHSVADLVSYLKHDPALIVDQQQSATIGGFPATVLDLRLSTAWHAECPDVGIASAYFAGTFGTGAQTSWYTLGIATGERQRLMLVDLGEGDIVAIVVDSSSSARFTGLTDAATPIIDSFQFK